MNHKTHLLKYISDFWTEMYSCSKATRNYCKGYWTEICIDIIFNPEKNDVSKTCTLLTISHI